MPVIPQYERQYALKLSGGNAQLPEQDSVQKAIAGLGAAGMSLGDQMGKIEQAKVQAEQKMMDSQAQIDAANFLIESEARWQRSNDEDKKNWTAQSGDFAQYSEKRRREFEADSRRELSCLIGGNRAGLRYFDANAPAKGLEARQNAFAHNQAIQTKNWADSFKLQYDNSFKELMAGGLTSERIDTFIAQQEELVRSSPYWGAQQQEEYIEALRTDLDIRYNNSDEGRRNLAANLSIGESSQVIPAMPLQGAISAPTGGKGSAQPGASTAMVEQVSSDAVVLREGQNQDSVNEQGEQGPQAAISSFPQAFEEPARASTPVYDANGNMRAAYLVAGNNVTEKEARNFSLLHLTPQQVQSVREACRGDETKFRFLCTVLAAENYGHKSVNMTATSGSGAIGPFQVMPSTARALGYSPEDMKDFGTAAQAAGKLYDDMAPRYKGNIAAMFADYNSGIKAGRAVASGKDAPFSETRKYVRLCMASYDAVGAQAVGAAQEGVEQAAAGIMPEFFSQQGAGAVGVRGGLASEPNVVGRYPIPGYGEVTVHAGVSDAFKRLSYDEQYLLVGQEMIRQEQEKQRVQLELRQRELRRNQEQFVVQNQIRLDLQDEKELLLSGKPSVYHIPDQTIINTQGETKGEADIAERNALRIAQPSIALWSVSSKEQIDESLKEIEGKLDLNNPVHAKIYADLQEELKEYEQRRQADPVEFIRQPGSVFHHNAMNAQRLRYENKLEEALALEAKNNENILAYQQSLGINTKRLLTNEEVKKFTDYINKEGHVGAVQLLNQIEVDYGEKYAPQVIQELVQQSKDAEILLALSSVERGSRNITALALSRTTEDLWDGARGRFRESNGLFNNRLLGNDYSNMDLNSAVSWAVSNKEYQNFVSSWLPTKATENANMISRKLITRLTFTHIGSSNLTPEEANNRAVREVLPQYQYILTTQNHSVRIPMKDSYGNTLSATKINDGLMLWRRFTLSNLPIDFNVLGTEKNKEAWAEKVHSSAQWITSDKDDGVYLVMIADHGDPVQVSSNGIPIFLSWADIAKAQEAGRSRLEEEDRRRMRQVRGLIPISNSQ